MINTVDVTRLLSTIVSRIESFDANTAFRLNLLKDVIRDGPSKELNAWAHADLHEMMDPHAVVTIFKRQQAVPQHPKDWIFAMARSIQPVLILLPIIITCYGLAQAAELYNGLGSTSPNTASSFWTLWQQGFNGALPPWLTAGSISLTDAVILTFIFLLTAILSFQSWVQRSQQELAAQELHSDLVHALSAASLYLAMHRQPLTSNETLELATNRLETTALKIEEKFERAIGTFDRMTQRVTNNFDDMTRTITSQFESMAQGIVNSFDSTTQSLASNFDSMIRDTTKKHDETSQQLAGRFNVLTNQLLDQLAQGSKYLKELGDLSSNAAQVSQQISTAATTLKDTNGELVSSVKQLVGPAVQLTQQQEALLGTATNALSLLQSVGNAMIDLGKKQDRWGMDLRNILDTLDLTVERAVELAVGFSDFTKKQELLFTQMQQGWHAQTELVALLTNAAEKVRQALDETNAGARSLSNGLNVGEIG